ncbi:MAG: leucyl aminopeptidase [bacterium]
MQVACKQATIENEACEALVIGVAEEQSAPNIPGNDKLKKFCRDFLALQDFKGKPKETVTLYPQENLPSKRILLTGLGEQDKYDLEKVRQAVGMAAKSLRSQGVEQVSVALDSFVLPDGDRQALAQAIVEGVILANYQYTEFKELKPEERNAIQELVVLIDSNASQAEVKAGLRWGQVVAEAANFTRDLQNRPGNLITPTQLANVAQEMARVAGLKCEVLDQGQMQALRMGALLSVARGSQEPPKFIVLEHKADQGELDTIVLVGKGITFDSGGISIKPGEKMDEMKFDMSGGGAVLGAMKAVAELEIPLHVVGLVPASENLPSGTSMKPGDILQAGDGTSIEVLNTDAEGRLVLADALVYARRFNPKAVVDLATLTGACVVALGHYASGLFGKDGDLIERLKQAAQKSGERVWELPLWDDYSDDIKGDYADIKNVGSRWGGAITAAAFLAKFAQHYPWAHLDIAGTAWTDKESAYFTKGGTGVGVRLLLQFLRDWVGEK